MPRSVLLAVAASLLVTPAAHAAAPVIVDQVDQAGDVNIYDGAGSKPSPGQRRSIDLERLTVTRTADGVG